RGVRGDREPLRARSRQPAAVHPGEPAAARTGGTATEVGRRGTLRDAVRPYRRPRGVRPPAGLRFRRDAGVPCAARATALLRPPPREQPAERRDRCPTTEAMRPG